MRPETSTAITEPEISTASTEMSLEQKIGVLRQITTYLALAVAKRAVDTPVYKKLTRLLTELTDQLYLPISKNSYSWFSSFKDSVGKLGGP